MASLAKCRKGIVRRISGINSQSMSRLLSGPPMKLAGESERQSLLSGFLGHRYAIMFCLQYVSSGF
jgi:hypothetical protein